MIRLALSLFITAALCGCAIDPNVSWAPDILKTKTSAPPAPEPAPDMRVLLQTKMAEFFLPSAAASNISFSVPRRAALDWTSCIRATVNGATGGTIGQQTYLFNISRNSVARQEHVGAAHFCATETYQNL